MEHQSADCRLLASSSVADRLPSRPVLNSQVAERQGIVIQRYRHPPATIDVPGLRDALLVNHLAGPVLVEEDRPEGGFQRRWTGPGQVSLTPAGQPIRLILKGRPDVALLYLAPELLHATAEEVFGLDADRVSLVPRLAEPDETADRLIRLLLAEAEAPGPGTLLMTETLGRALPLCHGFHPARLASGQKSLTARGCLLPHRHAGKP